ncbi:phosphoribosylamine--glycine ligase [Candidatus Parcubacteria bacterium]|nr:phosphoribosylamine--glycine ligase [Candidatus Parcubacteria bacterium]
MKVLLIGSGGREHALAWKIAKSPMLGKLYVAPGNAGTSAVAENVPTLKAMDIDGIVKFAVAEDIDLTIIGPDDPLNAGVVDALQKAKRKVFGPTKAAARIEASKVFSKQLMEDMRVPTAPHTVLYDASEAMGLVRDHFGEPGAAPLVLKADGLALGKGVYICRTLDEAGEAVDEIMVKQVHGPAGKMIVAENFVNGREVSMHALCDGTNFKLFPAAQDHKPIFDGDFGPNTGGMGTIAPVPWFAHQEVVREHIVEPILQGLKKNGWPFVGCLFPGIKISREGPIVLEYNARFGDPETQVHMRRFKSDLLALLLACVEGRLSEMHIEWSSDFAACIVLASEGYPSPKYKKGVPISGIEEALKVPGVEVFHAGTSIVNGKLVTSGGRVLGVTGVGSTLRKALECAYAGVEQIEFEGMYYRRDIGARSLALCREF